MRIARLLAIAALVAPFASTSQAQDASMAHMHGAMQGGAPDARQSVEFPPMMQANFLGNMRDHLQTLDAIVQALSASDLEAASRIANDRLGLDSPSAASCKPKASVPAMSMSTTSKPRTTGIAPAPSQSMDEMMAQHMPDSMRSMGLAMHTAASDFAVVARNAGPKGDLTATLAALNRVTQSCVACHSSYRLR